MSSEYLSSTKMEEYFQYESAHLPFMGGFSFLGLGFPGSSVG